MIKGKKTGKRQAQAQPPESAAKPKKKLGKTGKSVLAVLLIYAVVIIAVTLVLDGRYVRFYMSGQPEMEWACGEEFEEPGIYAVTVGRLFGEDTRRLHIRTLGQVDVTKPGENQLEYTARYLLHDYSVQRTVTVLDKSAPEIKLNHSPDYVPSWIDGYIEEGYSAIDNVDGDISDKVQRQVEGDLIRYTVTDSAGNSSSLERRPEYSPGYPYIYLHGESEMQVCASSCFKDPGYWAEDAQGNDLTSYVQVSGQLDSSQPGEYVRSYSITNALGETVSVERKVTVLAAPVVETVQPDGKTIYLTFDDGPGPYTGELLDILAEYDVKATFFVTCTNSKYADCIGRAYNEGHSIGVHTASHNYYDIYSSETAFFADFDLVQELIMEQTGQYTNICRFPGGSSNTVSNFNPGIMSRLSSAVTDMGYQYFDWNVSSGDAGQTKDTQQVAENIISGCQGKKAAVVLQHDIKDYSVDAVEQVIIWGLNNGYTFRALELNSPAAHHGINN